MKSMMSRIMKVINSIEKITFLASCVSILTIMLLTSFDVFGRKIFGYSIPSLYEFTEDYLMVALVFLSISYVYRIGGHVKVDLLEKHFPDFIKQTLKRFLNLWAFVFFALITLKGWDITLQAFRFHEVSSSVWAYPLGPCYFLVPLGSALTCIRIIEAVFSGKSKQAGHELGVD